MDNFYYAIIKIKGGDIYIWGQYYIENGDI